MNRLYTILLLTAIAFIHNSSYGQNVLWEGKAVDTIRITSSIGSYGFDKEGTSTGNTSTFVIVFDSVRNGYYPVQYHKQKHTHRFSPANGHDSTKTVYKSYRRYNNRRVDINTVNRLIKSLKDTNKSVSFPIHGDAFEQLVTPKRIIAVAKLHDEDWQFRRRYSTTEENNIIYKGCSNYDTFQLYLKELSEQNYMMGFVSDFWMYATVEIISGKDLTRYQTRYPDILGIPWYRIDTSKFLNYRYTLNIGVNYSLYNILPDKFLMRNQLNPENIIPSYIKWYLKRREIIYSWL